MPANHVNGVMVVQTNLLFIFSCQDISNSLLAGIHGEGS